ncbi:hypothetical protein PV325_012995, partial [Microctonus aethiopoides]
MPDRRFSKVFWESTENKTPNAGDIFSNFNNEEIRAYFLFLKFTLDSFNKLNALFQSRKIQIHILAERSRWILEQMAMCFLKPNALDNIRVDSVIPDNILPLLSINVEDECQNFLNSCQSEIGGKVKINCLEIYKVATREIINRLAYCDKFLLDMRFLNSEIALLNDIRLKFNKLDLLCEKFNLMPSQFAKINGLVLILLHSNAEAERAFSNVTDIIAKKRDRIGSDTVAA